MTEIGAEAIARAQIGKPHCRALGRSRPRPTAKHLSAIQLSGCACAACLINHIALRKPHCRNQDLTQPPAAARRRRRGPRARSFRCIAPCAWAPATNRRGVPRPCAQATHQGRAGPRSTAVPSGGGAGAAGAQAHLTPRPLMPRRQEQRRPWGDSRAQFSPPLQFRG